MSAAMILTQQKDPPNATKYKLAKVNGDLERKTGKSRPSSKHTKENSEGEQGNQITEEKKRTMGDAKNQKRGLTDPH